MALPQLEEKKAFDSEMRDMVGRFSEFKELKEPLTYIKNGMRTRDY